jgi:hypothetical protein
VFRARLDDDERLSLRHLRVHLRAYDAYAFCPGGLDLDLPGIEIVRLDDRHFRSHRDYSRLMLSDELYRRFERYEFVLVHQLDCLVLSDELGRWCEEGYDYIGAPWVRQAPDGQLFFAGVGNGGLSLRRVDSLLRVLDAWRHPAKRFEVAARHAAEVAHRIVREPRRTRQLVRDRYVYEDKFWSLEAPRIQPGFRIPRADVAVGFAFEREPRFCLEANGGRLAFGCHKWRAHDPEFWEPYLLRAGCA